MAGNGDLPIEMIWRWMDEARALRPYFYGEVFPLLSFSLAADALAARQYDRPDLGEGMADGFGVTIAEQPGSALITYKRIS
jgi:hypothetical protein